MPTSEIKSPTARLRKPSTCFACSPPISSWYPGGRLFFRSLLAEKPGESFNFYALSARGPIMTSGDSKITKLQTDFQALSKIATELNVSSDGLTKTVGLLDEA